jgi:hypothetical protein
MTGRSNNTVRDQFKLHMYNQDLTVLLWTGVIIFHAILLQDIWTLDYQENLPIYGAKEKNHYTSLRR